MDKQTRAALEGSIAKWTKVALGTYAEQGAKDCPLCGLFNTKEAARNRKLCQGCPINEVTGDSCNNSPYDDWWKSFTVLTRGRLANTPERLAIAKRELAFLKSLRPTTTRKRRRKVAGEDED